MVSVHSAQVNDGEWHSVSLEVNGNYARLVLDRLHAASGAAPGTLRTLNLDGRLFLGGHTRPHGRTHPGPGALRGCLAAVRLNGQELPLAAQPLAPVRGPAMVEEAVGVSPGCTTLLLEGCFSNPCANGGLCSSLPAGGKDTLLPLHATLSLRDRLNQDVSLLPPAGYFCKCTGSFTGPRCELSANPCASNPCLYGGTCLAHGLDFLCQCRGQYSGQR